MSGPQDARARHLAQSEFRTPLVLEAGAGTGKTAVLVARVIAWCLGPGWERATQRLGADAAPEAIAPDTLRRVAAITFTEAAAAEMATRVGRALRDLRNGCLPLGVVASALPADPDLRQRRAAALLGALDQLVVRTIHAFCRRLLLSHPLEAGLHPRFEIDADQRIQMEVGREVLEARLQEAYADPGDPDYFALADQGLGPVEVEHALCALLEQGLPAEALDADPHSGRGLRTLMDGLDQALARFATLESGQLAGLSGVKRSQSTLRSIDATRALLLHDAPRARPALEVFLQALRGHWDDADQKKLRSWAGAKFGQKERAVLGVAAPRLAEAADALSRVLRHVLRLDPERLDLARRVLRPLLADASEAMRRRGAQSFAGLLRDCRALLVSHPDVARRIRQELEQLLVDEFQDTDATQCEILRALALAGDPGSRPGLFLVGDPKQSIYGWRNADLRAYQQFVDEVAGAGGRVERLSVNFRSCPAILAEVDRLVAPVMREKHGLQPRFESLQVCPEKQHEPGFQKGDCAPVEYWISQALDPNGAPRNTSAREASLLEARALAEDVLRLHRDHGVSLGSVALLFRGTGDFEIYLSALRELAIPFVVERDTSYYQRREIIDASALVRCVLDPFDHLALVTALRSPCVGVPDAALMPLWRERFPERVSLLRGRQGAEAETLRKVVETTSRALPDDVPGLDRIEGWHLNLLDFLGHLGALREIYEREPSAVFVEKLRTSLLLEATEAARHLGAYRVANLDRFFRDLVSALEDTGGDASAVLSHLRRAVSDAREHAEGRPKAATENAVQVMTIHKAKGLDFDHVYLLQVHKGSGQEDASRTRVAWQAGRHEYTLFGAPTPGFHAVALDRSALAAEEMIRTLYVAVTRARSRLVIAGLPAAPRPRAQQHAQLIARRDAPAPDPQELARALGGAQRSGHVDELGVCWRLPALARGDALAPHRPAKEGGPDPSRVAADVARISLCCEEAVRRQARPLARAASEEESDFERSLAHVYGEEEGSEVREAEGDLVPAEAHDAPEGSRRRVALVAGTAVHAALEHLAPSALEPGADLAAVLQPPLEAALSVLGAEPRSAARVRAQQTLRRFLSGPLLERFRDIESHIVARELPVLLRPEAGGGPVGHWSGAIDLLYRDPQSGAWVVADYKTDVPSAGETLAQRADRYRPQGEVYVRAVREALGLERAPLFELWFLNEGEVLRLPVSE